MASAAASGAGDSFPTKSTSDAEVEAVVMCLAWCGASIVRATGDDDYSSAKPSDLDRPPSGQVYISTRTARSVVHELLGRARGVSDVAAQLTRLGTTAPTVELVVRYNGRWASTSHPRWYWVKKDLGPMDRLIGDVSKCQALFHLCEPLPATSSDTTAVAPRGEWSTELPGAWKKWASAQQLILNGKHAGDRTELGQLRPCLVVVTLRDSGVATTNVDDGSCPMLWSDARKANQGRLWAYWMAQFCEPE